jgi:hypothetical protein
MRSRWLICGLFFAALVMPSAAFAQEAAPVTTTPVQQPMCGSAAMNMDGDGTITNVGQIPGDPAGNGGDTDLVQLSAVHGMVVHAEGDLMLLKLPNNTGDGNAAPTYSLAGKEWAVVRLPMGCSTSDVPMGADVLAVGTPTGTGILEADRLELHG